jgi:formate-dependent nitrite reductase membrane component NrfD
MWLGGLSGAAQVIATVADIVGADGTKAVVRRGRYLALPAAVLGPALLIIDLHTPQRFFNMLRIFRRTSPMSIGTYVLTGFSLFSALTVLGQFLGDRASDGNGAVGYRVARITQVPAALAGAGMMTYTAALLSGTSTPLWAAAPCLLAMRFSASSVATAAAALSLVERAEGKDETVHTLDSLTLAAGTVELASSLAADQSYRARGVAAPLDAGPWGLVHRIGVQTLGTALPVALYALTRRNGRAPILAAVGILAGGFFMRAAILHAGNRSAKRPHDYFRFAQPGTIGENRHALGKG